MRVFTAFLIALVVAGVGALVFFGAQSLIPEPNKLDNLIKGKGEKQGKADQAAIDAFRGACVADATDKAGVLTYDQWSAINPTCAKIIGRKQYEEFA